MTKFSAIAGLAIAAGLALAPNAHAQPASSVEGVWRNPKNSVHVNIKPCGQKLCGFVIWASADAQEDARQGGTENLIGLQLLRDFGPERPGVWKGKVFVPDLRATFAGRAELVDANTLKARGCLVAGVFCKAQTWRRIPGAAD